MRKPLVVGNWKMNGSLAENRKWAEGVSGTSRADVAVCPPGVYLAQMVEVLGKSAVAVGSQDVSEYDQGAYTGESSAAMVRDIGAEFAIVGHSERRSLFGDTDQRVAAKFAAAVAAGLTPILCVGETDAEREAGETEVVVRRQLQCVFDRCSDEDWRSAVVAYEPVWAIGTGKTATPEQAQAVHSAIRQMLIEALGEERAIKTRLLYGGSVKPDNASALFQQDDIDGGLIGGASLKAGDFMAIVDAIKE
ncbi:MAG: triose-phosphate isomerase [Pseudomonadota bacterium]